jgi:hypothetical protein
MKKFVWAIMSSAAVASPVFAQDDGMAADSITCAEFLAMDADGRTTAVDAVQMASAEGGMASDDMASDDMASDDMASDDMASDDMASDDMMESDQMTSGDAMMAEDTVAAVLEVCERDPNVSLADAVEEATGH